MLSQFEKLIRTHAPKPRELPIYGSGGLHDEQQYCYELGYREGMAALRRAQREKLKKLKDLEELVEEQEEEE